ncbi:MarR family winged helix-turn-helix transcriptional regulator [Mesobaculum littorinae]|uniref:MarR family winged helix-turn-helix transcriptional regulator n=1 Tax=Mesobaculum littorinae TaxID=2486419 RepID=UPI001F24DE04|nr:MarR family winged helix-turn-helix transcriptional regulator [Mesobaculum littorinae]
MSDTIFDLLQLNSRILTAGDRLVAGLGLTSARWQVLGTMIAAQRPQPVAWIARDMGANRQNVQRIVNDLARDGLVEFQPNPHHRRAQLVVLTDKGMTAYDDAMQLQTPWVNDLAEGLQPEDIEVTRKVITALRLKLEDGGAADA